MKRYLWILLGGWALVVLLPLQREKVFAAASSSSAPSVSATHYYPLTIGNKWDYGFKRVTSFSMVPVSGPNQDFTTTTEGTQSVEIVRESSERSSSQGKVFVQRATEVVKSAGGGEGSPSTEPRLVGELYFRVNDRGIWLVADGEPDDQGQSISKITDRSQPLLWAPSNMKPDKSWIINCQIDPEITARIVARVGKAKTLKINGTSYENCLPVVSIADNITGQLDIGVAKAPIRTGRLIDLTWYAPGIGVVRTHQVANFELDPPNEQYTSARAHFEETQDLQPGYKAQE
jgi:hypothetical protein